MFSGCHSERSEESRAWLQGKRSFALLRMTFVLYAYFRDSSPGVTFNVWMSPP